MILMQEDAEECVRVLYKLGLPCAIARLAPRYQIEAVYEQIPQDSRMIPREFVDKVQLHLLRDWPVRECVVTADQASYVYGMAQR